MPQQDRYVDVAGQALGVRPRRHRRRERRKSVLWLLAAVLAVGAALAALVLSPPPAPPALSPQQIAESQQHVRDLKEKVREIQDAAKAHLPKVFRLVATENDLNTLLTTDEETQQLLASKGVEEAYAVIGDGKVQATARVQVSGVPVALSAVLVPEIEDHSIVFRVDSVRVGRLGVPSGAARRAAEGIAARLEQRLFDPNIRYRTITVKNGAITVTCDTQ